MKNEKVEVKVTQLCLTFCDPMDYTMHGILQARIMEWVAVPFSKGSCQLQDRTQVSRTAGRCFTNWATREAQEYWSGQPIPSPADLLDPRIELGSPALQADSLLNELVEKKRFQICFFPFNRKNHLIKIRRSRLCIVLPLWYDLISVINSSISWLLVGERKWLDRGFFQLSKLLILWISYSSQSLLW